MSDGGEAERERRRGYVALVGVQLCFGLFPAAVKLAADGGHGFTPRAIACWRIGFAALVLGGLALVRGGRRALPHRGDLPRLFACGLLGVVINQVLALEGIARTRVIDAGLLMTSIPVFTYAAAVLARQEVLRRRRAAGIALALAGAVLLALPRGGAGSEAAARALGNLLLVANCASYACYLVVARPLLARYSPAVVIGWVFLCALPVAPVVAAGQPLLPAAGTQRAWLALGFVLFFPTLLAYFLNTWALARVSASTTAVFIYLQPFVAGVAAWLVFGERLGPGAALAAVLLFAGLRLVLRSPARVTPAAAEPAVAPGGR